MSLELKNENQGIKSHMNGQIMPNMWEHSVELKIASNQ